MRMGILLKQRAFEERSLKRSMRCMPQNFQRITVHVMERRPYLHCVHFDKTSLSLLLFWRNNQLIDVSTTRTVQPGPVVNFLKAIQNVRDPYGIDWTKAKSMLKNLRIKVSPSNSEYKITGLSDKPCKEQTFELRKRSNDDGDSESQEITVYDYFIDSRGIPLVYSQDLPCINVGKPKRPAYIPIELCSLVPLQGYKKALSSQQRASLVEKTSQKPHERRNVLNNVLKELQL